MRAAPTSPLEPDTMIFMDRRLWGAAGLRPWRGRPTPRTSGGGHERSRIHRPGIGGHPSAPTAPATATATGSGYGDGDGRTGTGSGSGAPAATGAWYPPGPGTSWTPLPGDPATAPVEISVDPPAAVPKRHRGRVLGAVVGVAALAVAGGFAVNAMTGSSDGGADSPEAAVREFFDAVNDEDVLGAMDVVLPGERRTFKDPLIRFVEQLQRLDVLGDEADLAKIGGVDLQVTVDDVQVEPITDDIATVAVAGTAAVSVDGEQLPIGDLLLDRALDGQRPDSTTVEATPFGGDQGDTIRITTVEQDGRWYVSLWYSVAEVARTSAGLTDVPEQDQAIVPDGGDSPEAAMDQFLERAASLDIEAMISSLDPDEAEALQRYAPLFIGEAQGSIDEMLAESGLAVSIEDVEYDVTVDGDQATILPTSFTVSATVDGDNARVVFADGCATVTMGGEEQTSCVDDAEEALGDMGLGDTGLGGLAGFGGDAGLRMNKVDGEWYVSIFGTTFDALFAALESVDRADIEELLDGLQDGSFDPFGAMPGMLEDELEGLEPGAPLDPTQDSTLDPPASTPDDTTGRRHGGGAADPAADCYLEEDPAVALECMLAAQALDAEVYIPPAVRFPECGIASYSWTYSWGDLDDVAVHRDRHGGQGVLRRQGRERRARGLRGPGGAHRSVVLRGCESVRTRRLRGAERRRQRVLRLRLRLTRTGSAASGRARQSTSTGTDVTTVFGRYSSRALSASADWLCSHWVDHRRDELGDHDGDDVVGVLGVELVEVARGSAG